MIKTPHDMQDYIEYQSAVVSKLESLGNKFIEEQSCSFHEGLFNTSVLKAFVEFESWYDEVDIGDELLDKCREEAMRLVKDALALLEGAYLDR